MPLSLLDTNLRLLDGKLRTLHDSAYFDRRVLKYVAALRAIIEQLVDPKLGIDDDVRLFVSAQVWQATEFVAGSAPSLQPYEMVYGLQLAVDEWFVGQKQPIVRPPLIVTSLVQEPNFYFKSINPSFDSILRGHGNAAIDFEIVQIKLPDVYRKKPLYSVALYHELGHFIDLRFSISENVDVLHPGLALPDMSAPTGSLTSDEKQMRLHHLREYFADVFAACYCGRSIQRFLDGFAGHAGPSHSHPATYARGQVIEALLTKTKHTVIDAFNTALSARGQPSLTLRFVRPDIEKCFDSIRPVPIQSNAEVHGVLGGAWEYLDRAAEKLKEPWKSLDDMEIERVINDLVEKSIRNRMILEQWGHGAP